MLSNIATPFFCPQCKILLPPYATICPRCKWRPTPSEAAIIMLDPPFFWHQTLPFSIKGILKEGNLVILWGTDRNRRGRLTALSTRTGELKWQHTLSASIADKPVLYKNCIYFGTQEPLSTGSLFCLDLTTGQEKWRQNNLPSGVWSAPVLMDALGIVGLDSGAIAVFDIYSGRLIPFEMPELPPAPIWAIGVKHEIVLLSEAGYILLFDPQWRSTRWPAKGKKIASRISSPPTAYKTKIFFGTEEGALWVFDQRKEDIRIFAHDLPKIVAAPAIAEDEGLLLTGGIGGEHRLQALDLHNGQKRWNSQAFAHSIATTPAVEEKLTVVAANGGEVALLDTATGQQIWRIQIPSERVPAHPLIHQGVVYLGSDRGDSIALPWHLNQYERAATWLKDRGASQDAGILYAWAARQASIPQHRKIFFQKARKLWAETGRLEWVAHLCQNDLENCTAEEVARAYEQAGMALAHLNPQQAADYLLEASQWYRRAGQDKQSEACLIKISRIVHGPYIRIRPLIVPSQWQEETAHHIAIELQNLGQAPAMGLWVRFAGNIRHPFRLELQGPLLPHGRAEITAELIAHEPGSLLVEVSYHDAHHRTYITTQHFIIHEVKPFSGVLIEGSVGVLKGDPQTLSKVKVKGDVGLLKMYSEKSD